MTDRIKVHVVKYADCKNLTLRYTDPRTGKQRRKTADTTSMKEARKAAAVWEDQLRRGEYKPASSLTWAEFRIRYENEVVTGLADKTAVKIAGVFNVMERTLPVVAQGKLRDLNGDRLSELQKELRGQGRAESTIAGHLAHLRAALSWACDMGMIAEVPKIKRPKRAKRSGGTTPMKGRPVTAEEFERMLHKTATVVGQGAAESWQRLLRGLWWSGLRLSEALGLRWDGRQSGLVVDLGGRRPMLRVPSECEKGNRDRMLPVAPEFAEMLLATPEAKRRGRVFRLVSPGAARLTPERVSKLITMIGEAAGVVVRRETRWVTERVKSRDPETGKMVCRALRVQREVPKYASAHDLRRSFGERWAVRVMPQVLTQLMRHESIDTTMRFYVGRNANTVADAAWAAYQQQKPEGRSGTETGTVDRLSGCSVEATAAETTCCHES